MQLQFYKYQGTGNDFILLDNRTESIVLDQPTVAALCDRRFGIGADGLMLLQNKEGFDFEMIYFNSDGRQSSMCGNGGRCIAAFAHKLGLGKAGKFYFLAVDGAHEAIVNNSFVELKMNDVRAIERVGEDFFLNTGSPHYVKFVDNLAELDIVEQGRAIRYNKRFEEEGTNVNFIESVGEEVHVRTYERGVEAETFSCGTGVTACALVAAVKGVSTGRNSCRITTPGGLLTVSFERVLEQNFYNVWLKGDAMFVYTGQIDTEHVYKS